MSSRRIMIFDTTLRDGEQAPGIALQPDEKLEIGEQLERLGVDVIEAGFAASSPGNFEGVRAVARSARRVTVASLCRASDSDIDAAAASLADAPRSRLTMTLPIGKHSGRHAFSHSCVAAGLDLDEDELVEAFALFKTRADQGGAVSINELLQEVTLS